MDVSLALWLAVLGLIVGMLAVDLFAHRRAHVIGVREAAAWSALWVAVGVGFGVWVWQAHGAELGQQYVAGYLIEKSLAVDNVFVWAIIFTFFAVPREYQHRVLFLGVLGALVLRGLFIAGGSALIASFGWVLYLFAAFLLWTGWRMLRQRDEHIDPSRSRTLRLFRRFVPMTDAYHGQRFVIRRDGVLLATPLLAVLVLVEVTDVVFAVDSIPAIFAVTDEPFLVFTANAFAILGLRAMYFLLADLIHRFVYLKTGLALVLVWVGVKMLLKIDVYYIPTTVSLAVIATILGVSVVASLGATRGEGRRALQAPAAPPFRVASDEEIAALEPLWRRGGGGGGRGTGAAAGAAPRHARPRRLPHLTGRGIGSSTHVPGADDVRRASYASRGGRVAYLLAALGGALGALARWGVGTALPHSPGGWPWATLLVNLTGCLLLGALTAALTARSPEPAWARPFLAVGLLGGYTTYSAFAVEVVQLVEAGAPALAAGYLLVSVLGGVLAVAAGALAARRLGAR